MIYIQRIYIYFLYPLFTCLFAFQENIFHANLSIVGSKEGMHFVFVLWALCCEIALSIGFRSCLHKSIHSRKLMVFIAGSAFLFIFAILLPYLPKEYPIVSELHINLSFIALFSLLVDIALMVMSLRMTYCIYPYDVYLILIYLGALGIFGANYMSVNSLVEIYLGILLPIYLDRLGGYLK